jgi:hypothetical protein
MDRRAFSTAYASAPKSDENWVIYRVKLGDLLLPFHRRLTFDVEAVAKYRQRGQEGLAARNALRRHSQIGECVPEEAFDFTE